LCKSLQQVKNLVELDLSGCKNVTDLILTAIGHFPLKLLHLAFTGITNEFSRCRLPFQESLQSLDLSGCQIDSGDLLTFLHDCPQMNSLSLCCIDWQEEAFFNITKQCKLLSQLSTGKRHYIGGNVTNSGQMALTALGITKILLECENLKRITVFGYNYPYDLPLFESVRNQLSKFLSMKKLVFQVFYSN
jgi:hypothetical protein